MSSEEVLFERREPLGIVTLNRPRALNALTLDMIRAMDAQLRAWAEDDAIRAVAIEGAGDKAFCAGGDVLALVESRRTGGDLHKRFFYDEYTLNRLIHRYPKPYVALVDGVSMGGGVGVSEHGRHRIVTERLIFAMPETGIGLFPDVGGSWFLPRLPGEIGVYLGLVGSRIGAADACAVGLADAFVPSEALPALKDALAGARWDGASGDVVASVVAEFSAHPGEPALAPHRALIDRCFAYDTVEEILAALTVERDPFAAEIASELGGKSPTSLKVTLEQIRRGAALGFEDCMIMEYRMSQACMAGHDFHEGVRALLIDKDKRPNWRPPLLSEVSREMVEAHFAPLGPGDLVFETDL